MTDSSTQEFSGLRAILWPIHGHELRKFIPIFAIAFLVSFNYNILRPLKDTIVMNAEGSGAHVIPFIKVWVMFPAAVGSTLLFAWLSRVVSRDKIFYAMMTIFLGFYALFVFVMLPKGDAIHLHGLSDWLMERLPQGANGFVNMIRYWSYSLFYAMCELWGSAIFFLCFWSFVNEITKVSEAKRFYGLLGAGAHASGMAAGPIAAKVSRFTYREWIPYGTSGQGWEQAVFILLTLVLLSGVLCMAIYWWVQRYVVSDSEQYDPSKANSRQKKKKTEVTLGESMSYLRKSAYLRNIAIIVLTYNVIINLVEVIWKQQVKLLYPDRALFNEYMSNVTTILGLTATAAAFFISGNAIRRLGWTKTAMLTPIILLVTSVFFFGAFLWKDWYLGAYMGSHLLSTVVFLGTLQNVMSRGAKYTVYDATKELAFVPLSDEAKLKGKTTIDGVGTRGGKAGGSLIHQGLLLVCGTLSASAPYVAIILFALIAVWMVAVLRLGTAFTGLTEGHLTEEDVSALPEPASAQAKTSPVKVHA